MGTSGNFKRRNEQVCHFIHLFYLKCKGNEMKTHVSFLFDSMKLELISNAAPIKTISHAESNTIYEKDYYVFVIDDFNKV